MAENKCIASVRWSAWTSSPGYIQVLLANGTKTFGFGHGPGTSTIFGTAHGDLKVEEGQWINKFRDGTFSVTDEPLRVTTEEDSNGNSALSQRIWEISHYDEATISGIGASTVAKILHSEGWAPQGHVRRETLEEIKGLLSRTAEIGPAVPEEYRSAWRDAVNNAIRVVQEAMARG